MMPLAEFAKIAAEFCDLIDSLRDGRPEGFYQKLESTLANLHVGIVPVEMDWPDEKHSEWKRLGPTNEQMHAVFKHVCQTTEQTSALIDWYKEVHGKAPDGDDEAITRIYVLLADLHDLYRDLAHGLELFRLGTDDGTAQAAWEWRWGYENHWGAHLLRAATTVHEIRYFLHEK